MFVLVLSYLDATSYVCIDDQIVEAKKFITKVVQNWNTILLELDQLIKRYEKQQREAAKKVSIRTLQSGEATTDTGSSVPNDSETSNILEIPPTPLDMEENNLDNSLKVISSNDDETFRRSGVLKFFSNFLPNSENDSLSLKSPFNEDEHLQLPGKYIVNHRELSSIIAHALSMSEYEQRLNEELAVTNEISPEQSHEIKQQDEENENLVDDHQHIELHFHDSATKIYRENFLCRENFICLRQIYLRSIMMTRRTFVRYLVVKSGNHAAENRNPSFGKHSMIILF